MKTTGVEGQRVRVRRESKASSQAKESQTVRGSPGLSPLPAGYKVREVQVGVDVLLLLPGLSFSVICFSQLSRIFRCRIT